MFFNNRLRTAQSDPLWRGSRVRSRGVDINLAEDTVIDTVAWSDPASGTNPITNWQQIKGSSIAVTLRGTHTNAGVAVVYYVNSSATTVGATSGSVATGGTNFTVPIGHYVAFSGSAASPPQSTTITIRNQNTGKIEDTVTLSCAAAGGGNTVSPLPNWAGLNAQGDINWQQVLGNTNTITLRLETISGSLGNDVFTVYTNSSASKTGATSTTWSGIGTTGVNFSVSPSQYVGIEWTTEGAGMQYYDLRVKNTSDADAVLDTLVATNI